MNRFLNIILILLVGIGCAEGLCLATQNLYASVTPQFFETDDFPGVYEANLNCTWLIDSGIAGQSILFYSDAFFLNCSVGDYVHIYDGSSVTDTPLVSNLCLPSVITTEYISTGRYLLVQFVTDGSLSHQGFRMTYLTAADTSTTGCSVATNLTATSSPSYLTSPGFPDIYSGSASCRWLITAPGSMSTITVQFEFSDIENDSECIYDRIQLYDGYYICENKLLVSYCSTRTSYYTVYPTFTSTSNSLLVIFTSDSHDNYHGFVLRYNATIEYSTTVVTTQPTTVTTQDTSGQSVPCSQGLTEQRNNKSESNVHLIVISGLAGAAFVILVQITYSCIKYLNGRKRPKKGLIRVQSIAPIPSRTQHMPARHPTNSLSFV